MVKALKIRFWKDRDLGLIFCLEPILIFVTTLVMSRATIKGSQIKILCSRVDQKLSQVEKIRNWYSNYVINANNCCRGNFWVLKSLKFQHVTKLPVYSRFRIKLPVFENSSQPMFSKLCASNHRPLIYMRLKYHINW